MHCTSPIPESRIHWLSEFSEQDRIVIRDRWLRYRELTKDISLLDYVYGEEESYEANALPDANPANNASDIIRSQICTISSSEKISEVQKANPHSLQKDFPKE